MSSSEMLICEECGATFSTIEALDEHRKAEREDMLHDKIQELEIELKDSNTDREEEVLVKEKKIELKDSNTAREKEILVNEIDTLKCVLGQLFSLKPVDDKIRAIGIVEANNDFKQATRIRKQIDRIQDLESEISARWKLLKTAV